MRAIILAATVAMLSSLVITPLVIRYFRARGFGQMIRDDIEHLHAAKAGTPTMGGTAIVLAAVAGYVAARMTGVRATPTGLLVLGTFVGMGAVGFLDDFIKVRMNRNLGLNKTAKFVGQALIALTFAYIGPNFGGISRHLSFVGEFGPPMPVELFVPWVFVMLAGTSNAVNLTDGLDGLAAGSSIQVLAAYTVIAFWQFRNELHYDVHPNDAFDIAVVAAAVMAATAGFLWWNAPPAKIIMGDTGSLALGGLLAALALATNTQFLLITLGGIFVLEAVSVIAQVVAFRGFGRRVLNMAPLHHHFEMEGWQETTVIVRFWILAGIGVAVGLGIFYTDFLARGGLGG
ncbi:MAG TPA: phospho-N-acetylmuramoyl-pentapeptide-transferase [Nitriliruptorales bacterium]|nr:phospho-N-acetylmuramoyl-pentapeptide-transferase [Nitriliruptorales bacterium]